MGHAAQGQAQAQAARYENARYAAVSAAALDSYRLEVSATGKRMDQERAASSIQDQQITEQGRAARGAVLARAASAGIAGNSVKSMLRHFAAIESANHMTNATNLTWRTSQLQDSLRSSQAEAQARLSGAAPMPRSGPSTAGLLLGLGGSALNSTVSGLDQLGVKTGKQTWMTQDLFGLTK